MKYYHGSIDELPIGLMLKSQKEGYTSDEVVQDLESLFDKYKPQNRISRKEAVYLADDPEEIDNLGGYNDYVYEVKPLDDPEKSDLSWYSKVNSAMGDFFDINEELSEEVKEMLDNYWNGVASENPVWEYRVYNADIVLDIDNPIEVIKKQEDNNMDMKEKAINLTNDEANNFIENNPDGDILYHGINANTPNGLSASDVAENILKNGFKFSGNEKSLTPYSTSLFKEKSPACEWGSVVICFKLPSRTKLMPKEIQAEFHNWCKDNAPNTKRLWSIENLQAFGGYHGAIMEDVNKGTEYSIYDMDILDEGVTFSLGHQLTIASAIVSGKDVSQKVIDSFVPENLQRTIDWVQGKVSDDLKVDLKSIIAGKSKDVKQKSVFKNK
jgi:hypothetical protein